MSQIHNAIDYIEFKVTNMDESKTFYNSAFEWTFTDYDPIYAGIQKQGGGEMGGFFKDPSGNELAVWSDK